MSDIKHLVFAQRVRAFLRVYDIKEAGMNAPLYQAIPAGFWQNSLDVLQAEASRGQMAFTIKSRSFFSMNYDVITCESHMLGTVTRQGLFSHNWAIMDASTGVIGQLCRTATVMEDLFGGEYQIKIDERIAGTLNQKHSLWNSKADLHYFPNVTESINESLLISAALLELAMNGGGGGGGA